MNTHPIKSICPPTTPQSSDDNKDNHENPVPSLQLQQLPHLNNRYDNQDVFVVVRNPYTRAVAAFFQYYCRRQPGKECFNNETTTITAPTAVIMNQKIQEFLKKKQQQQLDRSDEANDNNPYNDDDEWIPQYDYVYMVTTTSSQDDNGNILQDITFRRPVVKHILQWEYLTEQSPSLMKAYGLENSITLPPDNNINNSNDETSWWWDQSVADLTTETRALIEQVYSKDFTLGGGMSRSITLFSHVTPI
jgi:hypothetical protein